MINSYSCAVIVRSIVSLGGYMTHTFRALSGYARQEGKIDNLFYNLSLRKRLFSIVKLCYIAEGNTANKSEPIKADDKNVA